MSIIIYDEPYPEISRHYYLPPPTTGTREALMEQPQAIGTREALMELRAAPNLTLKCVTFVTSVTL